MAFQSFGPEARESRMLQLAASGISEFSGPYLRCALRVLGVPSRGPMIFKLLEPAGGPSTQNLEVWVP